MSRDRRCLAGSVLAGSLSAGVLAPVLPVYFVRFVGLSEAQVGLALSVGGLAGLMSTPVAGRLADRHGARPLGVVLAVLAAACVGCYLFAHTVAAFVVVQSIVGMIMASGVVVESTLVATLVQGPERVAFRAFQRSLFNVGFTLGTLAAAVPLQLNNGPAYAVVMLAAAATNMAMALFLFAVSAPARATGTRPGWGAFRDLRYLVTSMLCGLANARNTVLTVGIPLWTVTRTSAPGYLASLLLALNSVLVVFLQVWAARRASSVDDAVRTNALAGVVFLLALVVVGVAGWMPAGWAVALLVLGVTAFTFAEMWSSAAGWTLGMELADPRRMGQYQGVFAFSAGIGNTVSPVLVTSVALAFGASGWTLLGLYFVIIAGLTFPAVTLRGADQ